MKIGLDLGMTNSTISYFDEEGKLANFKFSAGEEAYIPTVVSYDKRKPDSAFIGRAAKDHITDEARYETYDKFKLKLGTGFNTTISGKTKTPSEVARCFIENFLRVFREKQRTAVEGIVMTVPATWAKEVSNHTTRENIEEIFENLGYGSELQLESEPVAAAVYFCHAHKNKHGSRYNGFITVIDFGGGTLDVTLCEATTDETIRVLDCYGAGEDSKTNGRAGVAFDEAVAEKLIKDNGLDIQKGSVEFIELRDMFEQRKISQMEIIKEQITSYIKDPGILEGEELFTLRYSGRPITVYCKDLMECFNAINAPVLRDSLNGARQYFNTHGIDSSSQDNFRVLLVGGFSNFYAVEAEVRKFFGGGMYADKRFDQPFEDMNKSFAISRGAALIAQNNIVEHTCPYSIGYVIYDHDFQNDRFVPRDTIVIQKSTDLKDVKAPVYAKERLIVEHGLGHFPIFFDDGRPDGKGRRQLVLEAGLRELFPNMNKHNKYTVGFSLNRNAVPTLHIVDKDGHEIKTSLLKLYEKLSIRAE